MLAYLCMLTVFGIFGNKWESRNFGSPGSLLILENSGPKEPNQLGSPVTSGAQHPWEPSTLGSPAPLRAQRVHHPREPTNLGAQHRMEPREPSTLGSPGSPDHEL